MRTRRDVDAVAVDGAVVLLHHVAEMDADAKQHPAILGKRARSLAERALDRERAVDRAGGAVEDGEHRVAGHVDDAAAVGVDLAAKDGARAVERRDRAALVRAHQARIAGDVGDEDRRQALAQRCVSGRHGRGSRARLLLGNADGGFSLARASRACEKHAESAYVAAGLPA